MIRSLYSGVSGLRGFQTKMDVIGNNIANVNTVGFKKSRVTFQDMLSQTVQAASSGQQYSGGVNSKQIGLGTNVAAINVMHTPGSPITTNVTTDLSINGDGFFAVTPSYNETDFPDGIDIDPDPGVTPKPPQVYLTRAGDFTRDAKGNLVTPQGYKVLGLSYDTTTTPPTAPDPASVQPKPVLIDPALYDSFSISKDGIVIASPKGGGTPIPIFQVGVVTVNNPSGLEKVGGSMYRKTANASTDKLAMKVPDGDAVQILSGQLEMSNVDLTEEFTDMIITQRAFQANSRVITTSDSMLEEVVNLKR